MGDARFAGLVSIIGFAGLARGHGRVIHKFQEMLAVPSNDGQFLAVLAESVELIGKSGLQFLARDVGQLRFGHEGLGFGTDQFLLEDNNARRVGLLVLQLGDLVGDLLFACRNEHPPLNDM